MIEDARDDRVVLTRSTQVAIVGSGPAGAVLARAMARHAQVLVIESGGADASADTTALYEGETGGIDYSLTASRARRLGGTSHLWSGWCAPFDAADLSSRPWLDRTGWPFGIDTLKPYYARAARALHLNDATFDARGTLDALGMPPPWRDDKRATLSLWRFGKPTATFGDDPVWKQADVLCHANIVDIRLSQSRERVRELVVRTLNGREGRISAEIVVLACGGIETPRLLLDCTSQMAQGIGNAYGHVGRFFMEHPHAAIGTVDEPADDWFRCAIGRGMDIHAHPFILAFGVPAGCKREAPMLNGRAHFYRSPDLRDARAHIGLFMEQAPDAQSRVMLANSRTRLGTRRTRLNWTLGALDERSVQASATLLADAFASIGMRTARVAPPYFAGRACVTYTNHHIGTARMSHDPRHGVVDANCRVHDIDNLYIAGSAVFPTSSWANPTFTLVALSLRLAGHLRTRLHSARANAVLE
ncbi:choline dehydrogenase [Caballeronia arationis]|uniref:GMC oxidoreductase n=1 Tax=Caballeronia arationis TaxID=1777142 RepID=UPI00074CE04D|nr:GMC family oxidoreductase [Caballeronia arationis]SAL04283.1 choline dehydrogenase [Caballeronia arationis]